MVTLYLHHYRILTPNTFRATRAVRGLIHRPLSLHLLPQSACCCQHLQPPVQKWIGNLYSMVLIRAPARHFPRPLSTAPQEFLR